MILTQIRRKMIQDIKIDMLEDMKYLGARAPFFFKKKKWVSKMALTKDYSKTLLKILIVNLPEKIPRIYSVMDLMVLMD